MQNVTTESIIALIRQIENLKRWQVANGGGKVQGTLAINQIVVKSEQLKSGWQAVHYYHMTDATGTNVVVTQSQATKL
jgi:hypothetical protein